MVFKSLVKGLRIPLLILVGLFLATPAFTSPCSNSLYQLAKGRLKEEFDDKLIDKMAKAAIAQLSRDSSFPEIYALTDALTPKEFKAPPKSKERQFILDVISYAQKKFPEEYTRIRKPLLKEAVGFMETEFRTPTAKEMAEGLNLSESEFKLIFGSTDGLFQEIKEALPKSIERLQNVLAFAYANLATKTGRSPTPAELAFAIRISDKQLEAIFEEGSLYKNFESVKERATALRPKSFYQVNDTDFFNDERVQRMEHAIETRKTIFYTTAVAGAPVSEAALAAALKICDETDGEIIVRPLNMITYGLDPLLLNNPRIHIALHTLDIGPSLALDNMKLTAKQINALTGLGRIGPRGQSRVFGSPKMAIETIPTVKNATNPHILMTTGAITEPYYEGPLYIQGRKDRIATEDHVIGGLIIQKDSETSGRVLDDSRNVFHTHHVEFIPEKDGFMFHNKFYTGKKSRPGKTLALNLGDTHPGDTDPIAFDTLPALFKLLDPEIVTVEDAFNGHSLSHHNENKALTKSLLASQGKLDVVAEGKLAAAQLNEILKMSEKAEIIIKVANHNNWVLRWLEDQAYVKDDVNRVIGAELFLAGAQGKDPLEYLLRKYGLGDTKRVKFLKPGETYAVGPKNRRVWLHLHGHAGANGAKALSLEAIRKGAGRGIKAHTHTLARSGGAVNIGTLTRLILSYNQDGLSNWVQAVSAVGENGEIQVYQFKNGRWFAPIEAVAPSAKAFFEPGFPHIVPNNLPSDGTGQLDEFNRRAGRK